MNIIRCASFSFAALILSVGCLAAQSLQPVFVDSTSLYCRETVWCAFYPDSTQVIFTGCTIRTQGNGRIVRFPIGRIVDKLGVPDSANKTIHSVVQGDMSFNHDSSHAASFGFWGIVWDMTVLDEVRYLPYLPFLNRITYTPDGDQLVALTMWGIKVLDAGTGVVIREIGKQGSVIEDLEYKQGLAISPDGTLLAESTDSGWVRMYDYESGEKLWEFRRRFFVRNIQFSPDGKKLLLVGADIVDGEGLYESAEYDVVTHTKLRSYPNGTIVKTARYDRSGTRMVTTGLDSLVRVWSTVTGEQLAVIEYSARLNWAEFSAGGTRIAIAGDKGVAIWDLQPVSSVSEPVAGEAQRYLQSVHPNPARQRITVPFVLPEASSVCIRLFNALGEEAALVADGAYEAGAHRVDWNIEDLPAGIYTVALQSEGRREYEQLHVLR